MALSPSDILSLYRFPLLNRGAGSGGGSGSNPGEGDYTSYVKTWQKDLEDDWGIDYRLVQIQWFEVYPSTIVFVSGQDVFVTPLDGSSAATISVDPAYSEYWWMNVFFSAHRKYALFVTLHSATQVTTLHIFKDGIELQTIDINASLGLNNEPISAFGCVSSTGKYIAIGVLDGYSGIYILALYTGVGVD